MMFVWKSISKLGADEIVSTSQRWSKICCVSSKEQVTLESPEDELVTLGYEGPLLTVADVDQEGSIRIFPNDFV